MNDDRLNRRSALSAQEHARIEAEKMKAKAYQIAVEQKAVCERLLAAGDLPKLKSMALAIQKEYECGPPKTTEDRAKWESYMAISWAFNRFFGNVETLARTPLVARDFTKGANQ